MVLALSLLAAPAARADDTRWALRLGLQAWVSGGSEVTIDEPDGARSTQSIGDASGVGVGLEFLLTQRIGLEVGAFLGDLDSDFAVQAGGVRLTDTEKIAVESFSVGVNYHFGSSDRLDLYAGGYIAMTSFDDVIHLTEAGRRDKRTFDDDFGYGAKLGLDYRLGSGDRWFLNAEGRYLLTILETDGESRDLDLDSFILVVGVGLRF